MKLLHNYGARFALLAVFIAMFVTVADCADPTDEAKNKESCTGTCNTCPGKASAIADMADMGKVLFSVGAIENADEVKKIREAITGQVGVEACVPFLDNNWVWIAFDASLTSSAKLKKALVDLGLNEITEVQSISPLKGVKKNHERVAIYAIMPTDAKGLQAALSAVSGIVGVSSAVYDRAFKLLLVDFDTTATDAQKVKLAIVAEGYAAGLPGEDMLQPTV